MLPVSPVSVRSPSKSTRQNTNTCTQGAAWRQWAQWPRMRHVFEHEGEHARHGEGVTLRAPTAPASSANPGLSAQIRRPCQLDCECRRVRTGELQVGNGLRDAREKRRGVSGCGGRGVRCILEREDTVVGGGVVAEQRLRGGGHVLGALLGVSGGTVAETRAARWIRLSRGVHVGRGCHGMLGRVVLVAAATGGGAVGLVPDPLHGIEAPDDEHLWAQVELGVRDEVGHNDPDDSAPEPARAVNTVNTSTPRERMGRGNRSSPRLRPTWQGYGGKRRNVADERDLGLGGTGVAAGDSCIGRGLKDNCDDGLA
ncbi:hypothetical protein B0H14DRAFT_2594642 [Mycena olivaceomarginata]|nr:hypothetical protein B0H14DRAFT_2594642 [Mycena olivaceomarginata]